MDHEIFLQNSNSTTVNILPKIIISLKALEYQTETDLFN